MSFLVLYPHCEPPLFPFPVIARATKWPVAIPESQLSCSPKVSLRAPEGCVAIFLLCSLIPVRMVPKYQRLPRRPKYGLLAMTDGSSGALGIVIARPRRGRSNLFFRSLIPVRTALKYQRLPRRPKYGLLAMTDGGGWFPGTGDYHVGTETVPGSNDIVGCVGSSQ